MKEGENMKAIEIENKLNELKDCENIAITTLEGFYFKVPYKQVINNKEQEYIFVDAIFEYDKKMFLYPSIKDIIPA